MRHSHKRRRRQLLLLVGDDTTVFFLTTKDKQHDNNDERIAASRDDEKEKQQQQQEEQDATNNDEQQQQHDKESSSTTPHTWNSRLCAIYIRYEFLILVIAAILVARAYPPLGVEYLKAEITATWIAVMFVFVIAGLGLKTSEFTNAFQQFRFHAVVQLFSFGVVSAIVFGASRLLIVMAILPQSLADGMVICSSLPMTINTVLVFTKAGGGDEAAAIFNAAFGNMLGVFLSPLLILGYLGFTNTADIDMFQIFCKLMLRVAAPVLVGQIARNASPTAASLVRQFKMHLKKAQIYALVFIVYTVFCRTFQKGDSSTLLADIFLMIAFQFLLLCTVMIMAWYLLKFLFPNEPKLRVMGLFGCTHKTAAMGVPLINAMYENDPGLFILPLLIWYPMQLVLGSFLVPQLASFVAEHQQHARLGTLDSDRHNGQDDDDDDDDGSGEKHPKQYRHERTETARHSQEFIHEPPPALLSAHTLG